MADEDHLARIWRGTGVWNQWRSDEPKVIRPCLAWADLCDLELSGYNLSAADLSGAELCATDLSEADLSGADLSQAILRGADLSGAILVDADLTDTDLTDANLSGAIMAGARLGGATVYSTMFVDIDLSTVGGLEAITHRGPSSVGVDTLNRSRGQIPGIFLRGCGLSDWQIETSKLYRPDLKNQDLGDILYRIHDLRAQQPIQISPLFVSYSHADADFVDHLERYLVNAGTRFWRDVHHATAGRLERQVDRAIRLNPTVLLILSENAIESDWVEHEVRLARRLEKETGRDVLCPLALDASWEMCRWPERLRVQIEEYNILDFSGWRDPSSFDRMYRRLIEGLDLYYRKEGA